MKLVRFPFAAGSGSVPKGALGASKMEKVKKKNDRSIPYYSLENDVFDDL